MTSHKADKDSARPHAAGDATPAGDDEARELLVFRAGARLFAVFAEEVEATAERLRPAPLPFTPPCVVGVVPLRGRMRTALDARKLLEDAPPDTTNDTPPDTTNDTPPDATSNTQPDASNSAQSDAAGSARQDATTEPAQDATGVTGEPPRLYVALAGDEQLALACDAAEGRTTASAADFARPADAPAHVRALLDREGRRVTVLDPPRLFDAAMRGTDRRRRRT